MVERLLYTQKAVGPIPTSPTKTINHEKPKQQTYENSNGGEKDAFDLSPENLIKNLKEESSLKQDSEENNQKRIEEIKNNLRKTLEPVTFNESKGILKHAGKILLDEIKYLFRKK